MKHVSTSTGDQLTHALSMLGVNFILGGKDTNESLHKHPARLISALAQSDEARLHLSLIPLFLEHPEYASHVRSVAKGINPSARLTLQCYYSAAVWLQRKYHLESTPLPDHFSKDLNLTLVDEPEENLRLLAKRHRELSRSLQTGSAPICMPHKFGARGLNTKKGRSWIIQRSNPSYKALCGVSLYLPQQFCQCDDYWLLVLTMLGELLTYPLH